MNNSKFDWILEQIHEPGTDVMMRLLKPRCDYCRTDTRNDANVQYSVEYLSTN